MNILDGIDTILTDGGITAPIKHATQPAEPHTVITLIDTGGEAPDSEIPLVQYPTCQVLIRAATYSAGKAILDSVRNLLHGQIARTVDGVHFFYITAIAEGGHIGADEQGREEFSINFKTMVRPHEQED